MRYIMNVVMKFANNTFYDFTAVLSLRNDKMVAK